MLLRQINLPFRSLPSRVEEDLAKGKPADIALKLAKEKALAVRSDASNWILGADTIVVLGDIILGKPANHGEAKSMLNRLSDKEHDVITGFSIINPSGEVVHEEYVTTLVCIKGLTEREINAYIATGEPFGKAGGYAVQGIGSFMVKEIKGSYSNVVGLPLYALIRSLLAIGALKDFPFLRGKA